MAAARELERERAEAALESDDDEDGLAASAAVPGTDGAPRTVTTGAIGALGAAGAACTRGAARAGADVEAASGAGAGVDDPLKRGDVARGEACASSLRPGREWSNSEAAQGPLSKCATTMGSAVSHAYPHARSKDHVGVSS